MDKIKNMKYTNYISATRYIDDLLAFVAFDKTNFESLQKAMDIVEILKEDTYHKDMNLKDEDTQSEFNFLAGKLHIQEDNTKCDKIILKYNNKNYKHFKNTGKLKLKNMQHRHSFITKEQAKAKIIGQLHRIQQITDQPTLIWEATKEFLQIAQHLKYNNHEIFESILHMITKGRNETTWRSILKKTKLFCL